MTIHIFSCISLANLGCCGVYKQLPHEKNSIFIVELSKNFTTSTHIHKKAREAGEKKMELTREDWERELREANIIHRDSLMNAAINKSIIDLAKNMIKEFKVVK